MKITKRQLKRIIKEELTRVLTESDGRIINKAISTALSQPGRNTIRDVTQRVKELLRQEEHPHGEDEIKDAVEAHFDNAFLPQMPSSRSRG